ncbi:DUF397 domain-containing protein [Actinokineospora sp. 24-640]
MTPDSPPRTGWRKSSHSTATGNCVEVAPTANSVSVRDSKHPAAGAIALPTHTWAAFTASIGGFDSTGQARTA